MEFSRNHSSYLLLGLLIAGISFLFLSLLASLSYLYFTQSIDSIDFPYWFVLATIFIGLISYYTEKMRESFKNAEFQLFKGSFQLILVSVILFLIAQLRSWWGLLSEDVFMDSNNAYAFLYLLSGLHLLHVLAAIPFMLFYYLQFIKKTTNVFQREMYFADITKYRSIDQLGLYLHYMGVLWIILLVSFTIMAILI
ncbi:MAG: hypothetical protein EA409_06440 [Saprospirales bacterium]|nr:MAG: hypothetical protein EA409_06440 [Saprospirales bacterium]